MAHSVDTRGAVGWLRRFARTTPGVVGLVAITVAVACVLAGVVCGGQLDARIGKHDAVLDRSEPFADAAQNLYAALSAADAAAASAYLAREENGPARERYQQALADAAAALTDVTAGAADTAIRSGAANVSAQLSAYAGLVEAARANSRQGFPVGAAYLGEASALMQNTMLPGAESIFTHDLATVDADQRAVSSLPSIALGTLALALAAIVVGSVLVFTRTNRRFNVGLLAAAALVVLGGVWIVGATQLAAGAIEQSRTDGTAKFEHLAKARILAQQARTDETLLLITRGDVAGSEASFTDRIDRMNELLGQASSRAATDPVSRWTASHARQVAAYRGGDYTGAVEQAIGTDPAASSRHFADTETALREELERNRTTLRDEVAAAGGLLTFSPTGTLVLMVAAAAAAAVGLWPRLKEFL